MTDQYETDAPAESARRVNPPIPRIVRGAAAVPILPDEEPAETDPGVRHEQAAPPMVAEPALPAPIPYAAPTDPVDLWSTAPSMVYIAPDEEARFAAESAAQAQWDAAMAAERVAAEQAEADRAAAQHDAAERLAAARAALEQAAMEQAAADRAAAERAVVERVAAIERAAAEQAAREAAERTDGTRDDIERRVATYAAEQVASREAQLRATQDADERAVREAEAKVVRDAAMRALESDAAAHWASVQALRGDQPTASPAAADAVAPTPTKPKRGWLGRLRSKSTEADAPVAPFSRDEIAPSPAFPAPVSPAAVGPDVPPPAPITTVTGMPGGQITGLRPGVVPPAPAKASAKAAAVPPKIEAPPPMPVPVLPPTPAQLPQPPTVRASAVVPPPAPPVEQPAPVVPVDPPKSVSAPAPPQVRPQGFAPPAPGRAPVLPPPAPVPGQPPMGQPYGPPPGSGGHPQRDPYGRPDPSRGPGRPGAGRGPGGYGGPGGPSGYAGTGGAGPGQRPGIPSQRRPAGRGTSALPRKAARRGVVGQLAGGLQVTFSLVAHAPARTGRWFRSLSPPRRRQVALASALGLALILVVALLPVFADGGGGQQQQTNAGATTPTDGASASATGSPSPSVSPTRASLFNAGPVSVATPGWYGWALLDRVSGKIIGSANMAATNDTASMIKAWIGADYLRQQQEKGLTPTDARLQEISVMIRNSDNNAAQDLFEVLGKNSSIKRLVDICGLTDTYGVKGFWSNTEVSPRDAVRMGNCIGDGRAAGTRWTEWLLNEMRHTTSPGNLGILPALPPDIAANTAVKNGWIDRTAAQEWHVNCLAIGDTWVLAIEQRYPIALGVNHGWQTCQSVTEQLLR